MVDEELVLHYVSPSLCRVLGATDLHGTSLLALVRDGDAVRDALDRVEEGDEIELSIALRREGPGVRELHVRGVRSEGRFLLAVERTGQTLGEVLDRVTDSIIVYDEEFRIVHLNHAAEELLGERRESLVGRILWEAFPRSVGTEGERQFRRAMAERIEVEYTLFARSVGRWVAVRLYPSDRGLVAYFRDDSERRRSEQALRDSEERYRAIFESTLEPMVITRNDGSFEAVNAAACEALRGTPEEVIRFGARVVDPDDPRGAALLEERRRTGRAHGETTIVRVDGTKFPAEVSSVAFRQSSGMTRMVGTFRDLTETKRTERTLALLADIGTSLTSALEEAPMLERLADVVVPRFADALVVELTSGKGVRHGVVRHVDAALEEELGRAGPVPRQRCELPLEHTSDGSLDDVDAAMRELFTIAGASSVVRAPLRFDGACAGALLAFRCGARDRFDAAEAMTVRAVAERVSLALAKTQRFADTVAARRTRDDVLAVVAHDLRTPLSAVSISAQLLARRIGEGEEIAAIRRSVRRAVRLIDDLVLVARIEAGELPLVQDDVDVAVLLTEVVADHAPLSRDAGVRLESQCPSDVHAVFDRKRIHQCLSNLLSNAMKFTPRGGLVRVAARERDDDLEIAVADTGPGVDPQELPRLFDRFWQSAKMAKAGSGLGLAIAKGIVDAHGGRIVVTNNAGAGVTFTVQLPRRAASGLRTVCAPAQSVLPVGTNVGELSAR